MKKKKKKKKIKKKSKTKRKVKKLSNEIIERRLSDAFSAGIICFQFLYLIFLP